MASKSSIQNQNPLYVSNLPTWQKCRDAYEGQNNIKDRGTTYLPQGNGQSDNTYKKYKARAVYYNATKRTVDGLKGAMFRNDPMIEVPSDFEEIMASIGFGGKSDIDIAQELTEECIITSRVGLMVDYPNSTSEQREMITIAEAEALGQRPYMSIYRAENIINWKFEYINNGVKLKLVVLSEVIEAKKSDMYDIEYVTQYRALYLDPEDGMYKQRVYCMDGGHSIDETFMPVINGQGIDFIPFWVATPQGNEYSEIIPPVIKDLADINIAHYVNSADREQELYWAGVKMFVFPGWEDPDNPPEVGKPISAPIECKPMVLQAQAGSDIQNEMTKKEERMAVLGSQIISGRGKYVESATTAQINQSGEESILASISLSISRVLEEALNFAYAWYKGNADYKTEDSIEYVLNKDFNSSKMTPQEVTSLVMAWQQSAISKNTLFANFQEGELIAKGKTFEEEEKEIQETPPENNPFDAMPNEMPQN